MRVFSRLVLTLFAVMAFSAATALASHLEADCPMQLAAQNPAPLSATFNQSPHGVFRSGNLVYELRGGWLTTYAVTDLGDLQVAREDFIGSLAGREENGGITFANGFLWVSTEAGLESFDLRNVRAGGTAPQPTRTSPVPGLHYRRLAVNGNILAGLFPATDMPCAPQAFGTTCFNNIDLYNIANPANPLRVGTVTSFQSEPIAFNDIKFNYGFLVATALGGTFAYDVTNPASPARIGSDSRAGTFLLSNGTNFLAIGNDHAVQTDIITPPSSSSNFFNVFEYHTIGDLGIDRANPIVFHHSGWIDDTTGRLIMMVDELDPNTLKPARTIAFNTFDYAVPMFEGNDPRLYEQISYTTTDEVKHNPVAVGPYVYVIGELSGLQSYGVCGQMTGKIEWDSTASLSCGGAEIHGWVTGATKIANVELFLDGGTLGPAKLGGSRIDVDATTPVSTWRVSVNLDNTARGLHTLRAIGTDILGNRRQFASVPVFFNGPGQNCFIRRRTASK
jgi:hypothetical protein